MTSLFAVSLATRVPAIIADIIAVIVTWKHARGVTREASHLPIRVPLGGVLLEGGQCVITLWIPIIEY